MNFWYAVLLVVGYGLATYLLGASLQNIYWRYREAKWRKFAEKNNGR